MPRSSVLPDRKIERIVSTPKGSGPDPAIPLGNVMGNWELEIESGGHEERFVDYGCRAGLEFQRSRSNDLRHDYRYGHRSARSGHFRSAGYCHPGEQQLPVQDTLE